MRDILVRRPSISREMHRNRTILVVNVFNLNVSNVFKINPEFEDGLQYDDQESELHVQDIYD